MPTYRITGVRADSGRRIKPATLEAASEQDARRRAERAGLKVESVELIPAKVFEFDVAKPAQPPTPPPTPVVGAESGHDGPPAQPPAVQRVRRLPDDSNEPPAVWVPPKYPAMRLISEFILVAAVLAIVAGIGVAVWLIKRAEQPYDAIMPAAVVFAAGVFVGVLLFALAEAIRIGIDIEANLRTISKQLEQAD